MPEVSDAKPTIPLRRPLFQGNIACPSSPPKILPVLTIAYDYNTLFKRHRSPLLAPNQYAAELRSFLSVTLIRLGIAAAVGREYSARLVAADDPRTAAPRLLAPFHSTVADLRY